MLRKGIIRIVIALTLILLALGSYSSIHRDVPSRIYDNVSQMADKAKSRMGWGSGTESDYRDELVNTKALVSELERGSKSFEWSKWLDLDQTKFFDSKDIDEKLYPYLSSLKYKEEPIMPYEKKASPSEQAMIGRLYCRNHLSAPFRVVPLNLKLPDPTLEPKKRSELNDTSTPNADEDENEDENENEDDDEDDGEETRNLLNAPNGLRTAPWKAYEVKHHDPERRHRQYGHSKPTKYYNISDPLTPMLKAPADQLSLQDLMFPQINGSLFDWEPEKVTENLDTTVEDHAVTIDSALKSDKAEKYFHEVWITDDPVGYGTHYDWRFFRSICNHEEHVASLQATARAWQQFAESVGLTYWYAHGSLLGYLWNGMAMPWDSDHDIQMPIQELDRLARDFNRTLVVQDPEEGYRKFLIDVNPYYVQRVRGNGLNVIDARFIDVDTGIYIDITGLAKPHPGRETASCKNRHSYYTEEFSRLKRTLFEGYPALVPVDFKKMLQKEYRRYSMPMFSKWKFNYKVRLWEFTDTCEHYLKKFRNSRHVYCFPQSSKKDDGCMADYDTCDQVILDEYESTKDLTSDHSDEMSIMENMLPVNKETNWSDHQDALKSMLEIVGKYHAPFHVSHGLEPEN